jgi:hypothetical protein
MVLESSVQQTLEERLETIGIVSVRVVPAIHPTKEIPPGALGGDDGVGKKEVSKVLVSQRESS